MPARLPVVTEVQASAVPGAVSLHLALGIEEVHRREARDAIAGDASACPARSSRGRGRDIPRPATARARGGRDRRRANGRTVCTTSVPCSTSTRSIGAVPITSAASRIGTRPGRTMSPISASRDGELLRRAELADRRRSRVTGAVERAVQVDEDARAGRAVVPPLAQRREQRVARQLRHEVAGQPADRAEGRGAGPRRAGPALVVVAVADDADAIALLERVVQQPFERAPGRMHLDGALEPAVVGVFQVGVAAADMGDDAPRPRPCSASNSLSAV